MAVLEFVSCAAVIVRACHLRCCEIRQRLVLPTRPPAPEHVSQLPGRVAPTAPTSTGSPSRRSAGIRPVVVAATRVGALFVDVSNDAAVLARADLVPAVHREDEIALRNSQRRLERAVVVDLVYVDLFTAGHGSHVPGLVVQVVPAFGVVQASDHVNAIGRHHEVPVVEVVLIRREGIDVRALLSAWIHR